MDVNVTVQSVVTIDGIILENTTVEEDVKVSAMSYIMYKIGML